ncbi:MAG: chemotaxis protein CheW [Deltaproteobacteria bacterium]|nr:chemotaxis protein CheW [Deltaproteobacteria bacterium]
MDTSKYKALYLQETNEHISGIEKGLLTLEKDPAEGGAIDNLFRHYHSIKGMSASMGYDPLTKLAHAQEDLLDKVRSKKIALSPPIISTLLECLDSLKELVKKVEEDSPLDTDINPFLKMLASISEVRIENAAGAATAPRVSPQRETAVINVKEAFTANELKISNVMKVDGKVFDDLLTTVGDLFMVLSAFKPMTHASRSIEFKDGVHMLGKAINTIHKNILSARMLPIGDLTQSLPRIVRDICKASGKEVDLKIEGTEISLDRSILENLGSPLVHIIRNAVDHGIEPISERNSAGKLSVGTIKVKASIKRDRAIVEISDDGRGIDIEKIKKKAIAKGLSGDRVLAMSDKEAIKLICLPGLSTAETVTDTSGRGVGMDIVKELVEGIGGSLEIESTLGKGTKIILELPRTTSITKALVVSIGYEQFLVPISKIEKVKEVKTSDISGGVLELNGTEIPIISLGKTLGLEDSFDRDTYTILIVENTRPALGDKKLLGLKVDDFGDEIDAYIKPLVPPMSRLWGVSGIALMGDGKPVFLLDIAQIVSKSPHNNTLAAK